MQYIKGDCGGVIRFIPYEDIIVRNKMLRSLENFGGTIESVNGQPRLYSEEEKAKALGQSIQNKASDNLLADLLAKSNTVVETPVKQESTYTEVEED